MMKRTLTWIGGFAIAATLIAPFLPSCVTRACDGDWIDFGKKPGEGMLVDSDTWQTSPIDGKWIAYPHQRTYHFDVGPTLGLRTPKDVIVYISGVETPNALGADFTLASGSPAELSLIYPGTVSVHNDTCADYYMRAEIRVAPTPDAGIDDAASDAANDGSMDAGVDLDAPAD